MKQKLFTAFALAQIFIVLTFVQVKTADGQTAPRKIAFDKLADYVNDWGKRRNGEVLIVTDVPPIGLVNFYKANNLYFFQPDETGGVGNTFYTSAVLARSLRQAEKKGAASSRNTCTLVEFKGDSDVYRSPFATKVEGMDENGKLSWTVTGPAPTKLRFTQ